MVPNRFPRKFSPVVSLSLVAATAGVAGLCVMLLDGTAGEVPPNLPLSVMTLPVETTFPVAANAANAADLDRFVEKLEAAKKAYAKVTDYRCQFTKHERIDGKLFPESIAMMEVLKEPFSVHFKYVAPKAIVGQEVCYIASKNNGKMRVKPSGWKGAVGFVTIATDDARATSQSRHSIKEAGIGELINSIGRALKETSQFKIEWSRSAVEVDGRAVERWEMRPAVVAEFPKRIRIDFDGETALPVNYQCYTLKKQDDVEGELLEAYRYTKLQLNVGLTAKMFDK